MKKTIWILILSLLVFVLPALGYTNYTCTSTYMTESFEYNDAYTNHGWDTFSECVFAGTRQSYPYSYNYSGTFSNESFGINATPINCGTNVQFYYKITDAITAVSSGTYIVEYNITTHNFTGNGDYGMPNFNIQLLKSGTANKFSFTIGRGTTMNYTHVSTGGGSSWNIEECTGSYNFDSDKEYNVLIYMNLDDNTYTIYINKAEIGCTGKSLGVLDEISQVNLIQGYYDNEIALKETDDLTICSGYLDSLPVDDTIVVDDLESGIRRFYQDAGLQDEESQHIAGILILLFICGGIIYSYYVAGHGQGMGGVMGSIIIGFILSILLTVIDLLPLWIPILWFILGGVGLFFAVKSSLGGA